MKFLKYTLIVLVLLYSCVIPISATNGSEDNPYQMVDSSIHLENEEISFYRTFCNRDRTFANIEVDFALLLDQISRESNIDVINTGNVNLYAEALLTKLNNGTENKDVLTLFNYLKAYLHTEDNEYIRELGNLYLLTGDDTLLLEIDLSSPSYSKKLYDRPTTYINFNISAAISYAKQYAWNPNGSYRYFDGADCTNFASQIVKAGGIKMVDTGNVQTGWWYRNSLLNSNTWSLANRFCNWFGICNKSRYHSWFSDNVNPGDFVALDFGSDGEWDHIGFITEKNDFYANHTDSKGRVKYYKDYRVAQHTGNYERWSGLVNNYWEEAEYDGTTYAIVLTPR